MTIQNLARLLMVITVFLFALFGLWLMFIPVYALAQHSPLFTDIPTSIYGPITAGISTSIIALVILQILSENNDKQSARLTSEQKVE